VTELVEMARVRELLGMDGRETRLIVRRLRAIAEERGQAFPLQRIAGRWTTTRAALVALLPELVSDETEGLGERVLRQARELEALRRRVEVLENQAHAKGRTAA